jgi:hypothetical protein
MGLLLMLMTIGGTGLAFILFVISLIWKKFWLTKFVIGCVIVWYIFYAVLLVGTSLLSKEITLGLNEPKEFCGFYIDCHMHTVVTDVRKTKTIGDQTAEGEFYVVKVKVFSDARNPSISLRLLEPKAEIKDESGQIYTRKLGVEKLLLTGKIPLGQDVKTNEPFEKEIVFDVPLEAKSLRLDISEGYGIDKCIEAVLIGDEDSMFHARTVFKVETSTQTANAN